METTVSKWGNSLGVRISGAVAKEAGIGLGTAVQISAVKGRLILEPIRYDLKSLVNAISTKNLHQSVDSGSSVGNEVW